MAEKDAQDRTLPASPRKIQKAREEGQVARSRLLGHFLVVGAGVAVLAVAAPWLSATLQQMFAAELRFGASDVAAPARMAERLWGAVRGLMLIVVPIGLLMMAMGAAAAVLSGGWNWSGKALRPKFSKLDPLKGLARMVSKQQMLDALKACGLALIIGVTGGAYLYSQLDLFHDALGMALPVAMGSLGQVMLGGLGLMLLALAVFAAIDVPVQRFMLMKQLKMSHQEARQEHKELEGNQEVKAKMKVRMREMVKRRMMAAVPKADLVVMNPTHYAVALKYEEGRMAAPRIVAMGADLMALQIRDLARNHQVPVLQAPMLARALYAHGELDREVPLALYSAVAQVLAHVYQLRAALQGRGPMPGELPPLDVPPELDPHLAPEEGKPV